MSNDIVPTMRIADEDQDTGFVVINRADFDPATMVDFDAPKPRRARGDAAEKADGKKADGKKADGDQPPAAE